MQKLTLSEKRARNKIDKAIEAIVRQDLSGIPINIMDIGKVFEAGYLAVKEGNDLRTAIIAKYKSLAVPAGEDDGETIRYETLE